MTSLRHFSPAGGYAKEREKWKSELLRGRKFHHYGDEFPIKSTRYLRQETLIFTHSPTTSFYQKKWVGRGDHLVFQDSKLSGCPIAKGNLVLTLQEHDPVVNAQEENLTYFSWKKRSKENRRILPRDVLAPFSHSLPLDQRHRGETPISEVKVGTPLSMEEYVNGWYADKEGWHGGKARSYTYSRQWELESLHRMIQSRYLC